MKTSRVVFSALSTAALMMGAGPTARARAQFAQAPQVPAAMLDSPAFKPPAGSNVAIVEFSDLECPACAAANPTLMSAKAKYHVPWLRHDFPLPQHNWSMQAAINARWFDEKSPKLGDDYRDSIFAQQGGISTTDDLNQVTQKFAEQHGLQMPFVVDPQGKLGEQVRADRDLGRQLGVNQTPTIWVVTAHSHEPGHSFVRVADPQLLYSYLDQAVSATSSPKAAAATTPRKAHGTR